MVVDCWFKGTPGGSQAPPFQCWSLLSFGCSVVNIGMLGLPNKDKGLNWGLHNFHVLIENGIYIFFSWCAHCHVLEMVNVVIIVQDLALEVVVHLSWIQHLLFLWMCRGV